VLAASCLLGAAGCAIMLVGPRVQRALGWKREMPHMPMMHSRVIPPNENTPRVR